MRIFATFFMMAFSTMLFTGNAYCAQIQDSLLSSAELESTIVFLEDSQRVQMLTSELKQLLNARKAVTPVADQKKNLVPLNIFKAVDTFQERSWKLFEKIYYAFYQIPGKINLVKEQFSNDENRQRYMSLLLILFLSIVAGGFVTYILRRLGQKFRSLAYQRQGIMVLVNSTAYLVLTRSSFWIGFSLTIFITEFIVLDHDFFSLANNIIIASLIYATLLSVLHLFLAPANPEFRLLQCSNHASTIIVKCVSTLSRFTLCFYVIYQICIVYWSSIAGFWAVAYKIILSLWMARLLYKHRNLYVPKFKQFIDNVHFLPEPLRVISEFLVSNLYVFSFLFIVAMTFVSLSGYTDLYMSIRGITIKSIGVIIAAYVLLLIWGMIHRAWRDRVVKFFVHNKEMEPYIEKNLRILEQCGYGVVILGCIAILLETWGIDLMHLVRSDVPVVKITFHVTVILIFAMLSIQVLRIIVSKFRKEASSRMMNSGNSSTIEVEKRVATLGGIIQKIAFSSIIIVAVMMILDELGFDIKAMLAGVGIMGLAVGFGAQNLVRDIISGLFVIFENRIRVGDVAIINGTSGLVEQVNLRTSVLRGVDGTVHVFSNGAITSLSNMTHEHSYYVFNIGIAYKENTDRVVAVLKELGEQLQNDPEYKSLILEPLEIQGVDSFNDSSVTIKARFKTLPIKQWTVGREMNRRIKMRFDELGIDLPFPQRSVNFGDKAIPVSLRVDGITPQREEIKSLLRELLDEKQGEMPAQFTK